MPRRRNSKQPEPPAGLLLVDKPAGMTSHDVVSRVRRLAGTAKVGHGGTLDPAATGVLTVAIGRATRLLRYLLGADKTYQAVVRLGSTTTSDDAEGEITAQRGIGQLAHLSDGELTELIVRALERFTGTLEQIPPAVSAIKIDGKRAYQRVRSGEAVKLAPRAVTIHHLELTGPARRCSSAQGEALDLPLTMTVSSGTYVRSLARDLGEYLGTGAHLRALRRSAVGQFSVAQCITLPRAQQLVAAGEPLPIIPLAELCRRLFPTRVVTPQEAIDLRYGRFLSPTGAGGIHAALSAGGECLALIEDDGGAALPGGGQRTPAARPRLVLCSPQASSQLGEPGAPTPQEARP